MEHFHASTPALLVATLLILGLVGAIAYYRYAVKRDKLAAETELARLDAQRAYRAALATASPWEAPAPAGTPRAVYGNGAGVAPQVTATASPPAAYCQPSASSPTVIHSGGGNDMMTGMLLGSIISDHGGARHETVVDHYSSPPYTPAADTGYIGGGSANHDSGGGISWSSSDGGGSSGGDSGSSSSDGGAGW